MTFDVTFPGGVAVDATYRGHTIHTDQPEPLGRDSAMSPFDVFFASLATCAGFYALRFCQERSLPTTGLAMRLENERDPETKRIVRSKIDLTLPDEFPDKYHQAILRAIDQCAVKKAIAHPPEIEVTIAVPELALI